MSNSNMTATAAAAHTKVQAVGPEKLTRQSLSFHDVEKSMPHLPSRFREASLMDNLSSWLGSRNPFGKTVDSKKHIVWLFDNTAWQKPGSKVWETEFVAAYFAKNSGKDLSALVADIAEKVGVGSGDEAEATIAKRLQPFADSILPAHAVNVAVADEQTIKLGPSGRDGISNTIIRFSSQYNERHSIRSDAISVECDEMITFCAGPTGWAVLSDVDDTIKKTLTEDPIGILKTTFVEEPEVIAGMPEFYKYLSQKLENPPFWYLSASPYNLYTFLRDFRNQYYPPGQLILREASWMNLAGLLTNLTIRTESYKVDRLEKVHNRFPKRKFILIGDSTQTDPESYGKMYRKHPEWIGAIYIRRVTGVAAVGEEKNNKERFVKAFDKVPESVWYVFDDPQELYAKVDALVASQ